MLYHTASKMPKNAVKLATVRPDGSVKAEATGVAELLQKVA